MLRNFVDLSNVSVFGQIGLVMFFAVFIVVTIRTVIAKDKLVHYLAALPLDDECETDTTATLIEEKD